MSITIRQNDKPNLTVCKMNCDDGLHEKLNTYELTKFLNAHTTTLMVGRPRSGKTSLLYSLFKSNKLMKKTFHNIYVFQPNASRASMKDNIFGKLPDDQLYEELTYENLNEVLNIIKIAGPEENHCIIFDDMTAYLKNKDTLQMLKEMIFNRRHLHLSIYFLVQTWYSVPKDIRKLFNNAFIFKVSKNEMENIFEEVVEQKKELIPAISKIVFSEPYQFLFINIESQRMFKNWDELVIDGDDK
jgi:hypothetical protein